MSSVPWYADLAQGDGNASGLAKRLREALLVATLDRARESAANARRRAHEHEIAEAASIAAEQERREASARVEADALKQAIAGRRRRFSSAYFRIIGTAILACGTVLPPWIIGRLSRDSWFRPRSAQVFDTSVRTPGTYFKADFLAGCAWVIGVAAVILLVVALVGMKTRLNVAFAVGALAIFGGAVALAGASEKAWESAEQDSVMTLLLTAVPPDLAPCPGRALDLSNNSFHPTATFTWYSASWRVALRELTERDEVGSAEIGACIYSGWNYVTTVSLGTATELDTRFGTIDLAEYRNSVGIYLDTQVEGADNGTVWGIDLSSVPSPQSGPLPWAYADEFPSADSSWRSNYITTLGGWSVDLPARGRMRVGFVVGPNIVGGPMLDGDVGALLAIGPAGDVTTLASRTFVDGYQVEGGYVGILDIATPDTAGHSISVVGPDLEIVTQMSCPSGGAIWYRSYIPGFACGVNDQFNASISTGTWYDRDSGTYLTP